MQVYHFVSLYAIAKGLLLYSSSSSSSHLPSLFPILFGIEAMRFLPPFFLHYQWIFCYECLLALRDFIPIYTQFDTIHIKHLLLSVSPIRKVVTLFGAILRGKVNLLFLYWEVCRAAWIVMRRNEQIWVFTPQTHLHLFHYLILNLTGIPIWPKFNGNIK